MLRAFNIFIHLKLLLRICVRITYLLSFIILLQQLDLFLVTNFFICFGIVFLKNL